jgi:two-component system chemotaxis response regulator CheY
LINAVYSYTLNTGIRKMAKALIVDDSKFMRRIIRETLESGGHEVIAEADNGADGIECYRHYNPEFVTMDITMGGKDGINAIKEIMETDGNAKIIVISALNENTIKISEQGITPSAFVTKPFDKEKLLNIIKGII